MQTAVSISLQCLAALCTCAAAQATSSFRCGSDLVQVGDSKVSALQKCGRPVATDSFCKPPQGQPGTTGRGTTTVIVNNACETVDELTFNPGYGQFMTTLRFESGKLVSISYGERVR